MEFVQRGFGFAFKERISFNVVDWSLELRRSVESEYGTGWSEAYLRRNSHEHLVVEAHVQSWRSGFLES
jgi:hypothetical protein